MESYNFLNTYKLRFRLDPWQREFLETPGDKILICGRQIGKSEICALDCSNYLLTHPNQTILMVAPTERQSYALYEKTLQFILQNEPKQLLKGKDRPTKEHFKLKNGTALWCLPIGIQGVSIRFVTIHRLYLEEGARIPRNVVDALTPALLTTGGAQVILTTPAGSDNYAADVFRNKDGAYDSFKRFSYDSVTVIQNREICDTWTEDQREKALLHLQRERLRKSNLTWEQEYMGRICDALHQFFPTALIQSCMTLKREDSTPQNRKPALQDFPIFAGLDIARLGEDETVLTTFARINRKHLEQVDMNITTKQLTTETARMVLDYDGRYHYTRIYIDTGGIGGAVWDMLSEHSQTRRKIVAIDNATRSLDREDKAHRRMLKEDLYCNLRRLMEQGKIALFNEPEILLSLSSVQYEYSTPLDMGGRGDIKIFGFYDHIAESIVRAAFCMQEKTLKLWVC